MIFTNWWTLHDWSVQLISQSPIATVCPCLSLASPKGPGMSFCRSCLTDPSLPWSWPKLKRDRFSTDAIGGICSPGFIADCWAGLMIQEVNYLVRPQHSSDPSGEFRTFAPTDPSMASSKGDPLVSWNCPVWHRFFEITSNSGSCLSNQLAQYWIWDISYHELHELSFT